MSPDLPPMDVRIITWQPTPRGSLRGWATIQLGKLVIKDVGIFNRGARAWAKMPSKPQIDTASGHIRRNPDGKPKYQHILEWADRAASDRFNAGVIAALESAHPGATK